MLSSRSSEFAQHQDSDGKSVATTISASMAGEMAEANQEASVWG